MMSGKIGLRRGISTIPYLCQRIKQTGIDKLSCRLVKFVLLDVDKVRIKDLRVVYLMEFTCLLF